MDNNVKFNSMQFLHVINNQHPSESGDKNTRARTNNPDTKINTVVAATMPGSNSTFWYVAKYQKATKAPMLPKSGMPTKGNMRFPMRMATFSGMAAASGLDCNNLSVSRISLTRRNSASFFSACSRRIFARAFWPRLISVSRVVPGRSWVTSDCIVVVVSRWEGSGVVAMGEVKGWLGAAAFLVAGAAGASPKPLAFPPFGFFLARKSCVFGSCCCCCCSEKCDGKRATC